MLTVCGQGLTLVCMLLCREDGCLDAELEDVLQPHEVAAVAAVGPGGAPAFVLQVRLRRSPSRTHDST
jgi:hypothetical protein